MGAVCPAQHRAASVPEADQLALSSAQASWWARPQVVAWSVDRCAAEQRQPEARLREARHVRNVRARLVACPRAASLERQLAAPLAPGVQARPLEAAAVVVAVPSAQRQAAAVVPSALPVAAAAAEHVAAEAAAVPRAAGVGAAEEPASLQGVAAAEVRVLPRAEAPEELVLRAVARPSAAPWAFRPGRVLPWPAPPRAVRSGHRMRRSQIAPPTALWWQAARGEVWS
jgi:hypothetical protein